MSFDFHSGIGKNFNIFINFPVCLNKFFALSVIIYLRKWLSLVGGGVCVLPKGGRRGRDGVNGVFS